MKPEDVIVGKYYTLGQDIYLGYGKRIMFEGNFSNTARMEEKGLVYVGPDPDYMGLVVKTGDEVMDGFWNEIKLMDPFEYFGFAAK